MHGRGVLILGASGAGKSTLAIQLMALGCALISDDQVALRRTETGLVAAAPDSLRGMIEARGVGILTVDPAAETLLALVVDLDVAAHCRLPEPDVRECFGVSLPRIAGKAHPELASVVTLMLRYPQGHLP